MSDTVKVYIVSGPCREIDHYWFPESERDDALEFLDEWLDDIEGLEDQFDDTMPEVSIEARIVKRQDAEEMFRNVASWLVEGE